MLLNNAAYSAGLGRSQNGARLGSFQTSQTLMGRVGHWHVVQKVPLGP